MSIKHKIMPALAVALILGACGGSEPPPPPTPTGPTQAELDRARADSLAADRARRDSEAAAESDRARREEQRLTSARQSARATLEARVHFDYDESTITSAAEEILRRKLPILRSSPTVRLRLEGHADERGSTEYNLALGSRRAQSVQDFMAGFGISANQFTTTSFGEERPLVNRSDEGAWTQNRRVESVITGGTIVVSEDDRDEP